MSVQLSASADTSGLARVIPQLVSFGRRTGAEQAVTSLGMILQDAQNRTKAVSPTRMDAELNVSMSPGLLKSGNPSKAKKRQREIVEFHQSSSDMNAAMAITIARMNPQSRFNQITGQRWFINQPGGWHGVINRFAKAYGHENAYAMALEFIKPIASRMVKARHSSGSFLRAGFIYARDMAVSSPLFKNRFRAKSAADVRNPLSRLDPRALGDFRITNPDSPVFTATGENNVGQDGHNAVLDAKHRQALIDHALPAVNAAIAAETAACEAELQKRLAAGLEKFNQQLK